MSEHLCERCGQPIIQRANEHPSHWKARRFCSLPCYQTRGSAPVPERQCEWCHKPLVRKPNETPSNFRLRRFCGHSCVGAKAAAEWRMGKKPVKGVVAVELPRYVNPDKAHAGIRFTDDPRAVAECGKGPTIYAGRPSWPRSLTGSTMEWSA